MPSRGKSYLLEIRDFIGHPETDTLLLVIGPHAVHSRHVEAEWRFALEKCAVVVPLLRLGCRRHADPADARRVDAEDYGQIPAPVAATRVHAIDFRERRDGLPRPSYAEALAELWRALTDPRAKPAAVPGVPDLPPNYMPRPDSLEEIERRLLADADSPVVVSGEGRAVALLGMSGVGKSVLAAAFCRNCRTRRSIEGRILWVRAGKESAPVTGVAGWLQGLHEENCLVVLDDVWDVRAVDMVRRAMGPRGRLLVTTTLAQVATALGVPPCRIDGLTDRQSLQLMGRWADREPASLPSEATTIARRCGNLPLALSMVGAMMRGASAERWQDALADLDRGRLDEIRHPLGEYEPSDLRRAIAVSIDALQPDTDDGAWERHHQARLRYLELAIFPGETPIPLATLYIYWGAAGVSESAARKLADLFWSRSLARRDGDGRLRLHDLHRTYLVTLQGPEVEPLHGRLIEAYRARWPKGWHTARDDGYLFDHLAFHLRHAGPAYAGELRGLVSRAWLDARLAQVPPKGSPDEWPYRGFANDVSVCLDGTPATYAHLVDLARCSFVSGLLARLASAVPPETIGTLAAAGQVERAIQHASLIPGGRTRSEALRSVVSALIGRSDFKRSLPLMDQLVREAERDDDPLLRAWVKAWAAARLAETGEAARAFEMCRQALMAGRSVDSEWIAPSVRCHVAAALARLGRPGEARRQARRALKAWYWLTSPELTMLVETMIQAGGERELEKTLALPSSGQTGFSESALLEVAVALYRAGWRARATECIRRMRRLSSARGVKTAQRPDLHAAVALAYAEMGRTRRAEALARRAQAAIGRQVPPAWRFEALILIGRAWLELGRRAAAAAQARRALEITGEWRGREQAEALTVAARLLLDAGQVDQASSVLNRALRTMWVMRSALKESRSDTWAEALVGVGRVAEAQELIERLDTRFGIRDRAYEKAALVLTRAGHWERALELTRAIADSWGRSRARLKMAGSCLSAGERAAAQRVIDAIEEPSLRSEALCDVATPDDPASLQEALDTAGEDVSLLATLAGKLALGAEPGAARPVTSRAVALALREKSGHWRAIGLGDLAAACLRTHDRKNLTRIRKSLAAIQEQEFRADGELRLALALAGAGQVKPAGEIARRVLRWPEHRFGGRPLEHGVLFSSAALVLLRCQEVSAAVTAARRALPILDTSVDSSFYDKEAAHERAVEVLRAAGALEAAVADGTLTFAEACHACLARQDETTLTRLLAAARQLAPGTDKADALAQIAGVLQALPRVSDVGGPAEARSVLLEALVSAKDAGGDGVVSIIKASAATIAGLDGGETLQRVREALIDIESWWPDEEEIAEEDPPANTMRRRSSLP
jgi:tetratricopeptide (TPR) repeat protein